ncbi:MAG: hypothetical protein KAG61_13730 [Bacteriovoracaceae bacterium]|nr:hypothetical protein [Bacteriovoracaceae bacterium]
MTTDQTANIIHCYLCSCELENEYGEQVGRHEECVNCRTSLRCCRMCQFYNKLVYNECKEPNAERLLDKEKPNFCSYFVLGNGKDIGSSKDDLLSAANALFKI